MSACCQCHFFATILPPSLALYCFIYQDWERCLCLCESEACILCYFLMIKPKIVSLHYLLQILFFRCVGPACEPLLNSLPKDSETHMVVLVMLGSAHTMLQHYQQGYDVFSEGIRTDPMRPELWYNRALS